MWRSIVVILLGLWFISCSPSKLISSSEIRERIDTVYIPKHIQVEVQVPYEVVKEIVPVDQVAFAETSVAEANAQVLNGLLNLELKNKDVKLKGDTIVVEKTVNRDIEKIIYKTEIQEKNVIPIWIWIVMGLMIGSFVILYIKK